MDSIISPVPTKAIITISAVECETPPKVNIINFEEAPELDK